MASKNTVISDFSDPILVEHASEIHRLSKRVTGDIIEIGRRLKDAKKRLGHGRWLEWLDLELGWSDKKAQRFISVYEFSLADRFEYDKLSNLDLPISAIYLLAARSAPEEAREEIIERAQAGEEISVAKTRNAIDTAKQGGNQPDRKSLGRFARDLAAQNNAPAAARDDIGAHSIAENEHLRARNEELEDEVRRLQIANLALQNENEELKQKIGELTAQADDSTPVSACDGEDADFIDAYVQRGCNDDEVPDIPEPAPPIVEAMP